MSSPGWDEAARNYASTPEGIRVLNAAADEAAVTQEHDTEARLRTAVTRGQALRESNTTVGRLLKATNAIESETLEVEDLEEVEDRDDFEDLAEWTPEADYPEHWGSDPTTLTPQQAFDAITQPELVARYTQGDCGILAHALATHTGWGTLVVGDVHFEPDYCQDDCADDCTDPEHGSWAVENLFHAYAQRPDGRLVDIRGVHEPSVAQRLADTWGSKMHTYPNAAAADKVWNHEQWAESDEDLEDAAYVAAYVAVFGAVNDPEEDIE